MIKRRLFYSNKSRIRSSTCIITTSTSLSPLVEDTCNGRSSLMVEKECSCPPFKIKVKDKRNNLLFIVSARTSATSVITSLPILSEPRFTVDIYWQKPYPVHGERNLSREGEKNPICPLRELPKDLVWVKSPTPPEDDFSLVRSRFPSLLWRT